MQTLYLAHSFLDRKTIRKWELKLDGKYNINLDNPFYDHDRNDIQALDKLEDNSAEQLKYFRERNTDAMVTNIVEGDLTLIRKSDGIVTQIKCPSIGTSMEIIMAAHIFHVPVYVITKKVGYHPWIKYFATYVFKSRKEFEEFVNIQFGVKE